MTTKKPTISSVSETGFDVDGVMEHRDWIDTSMLPSIIGVDCLEFCDPEVRKHFEGKSYYVTEPVQLQMVVTMRKLTEAAKELEAVVEKVRGALE